MKQNHSIDFFSSPNGRFIGFTDIRPPYQQVNNEEYWNKQQKKTQTKSLLQYHIYEPIVPFSKDFFDQKLQQCQIESYSDHSNSDQQIYNNTDSNQISEIQNFQNEQSIVINQSQKSINDHLSNLNPRMFNLVKQEEKLQVQVQQKSIDPQFTTPKKKPQFFTSKNYYESTTEKQKNIVRSNEKGLRKLSSLAYSIVGECVSTSYKEVAQKLLKRLNYQFNDFLEDQESKLQRSSMQNIKRRVYDSLNVLIALGVIKRIGNKITKQTQKNKLLYSSKTDDKQKYQELLQEYEKRTMNLKIKKNAQKELRKKVKMFKIMVQKNKNHRSASKKQQIIRLPFLVFASNEEPKNKILDNQNQLKDDKTIKISWTNNQQIIQPNEQKKLYLKRKKNSSLENDRKVQQIVTIGFKGHPQSYGDLDFLNLLNSDNEQKHSQLTRENSKTKDFPQIDYQKQMNRWRGKQTSYPQQPFFKQQNNWQMQEEYSIQNSNRQKYDSFNYANLQQNDAHSNLINEVLEG